MKKTVLYEYLGTNGTIVSPIHLEDTYYIRKIRLIADKDYILKNKNSGALREVVILPEAEVEDWEEIKYSGQE